MRRPCYKKTECKTMCVVDGGGGGVGGGKETNVKRAIWNKSQCFLLHLIIFLFNFDQYNAKRAKTQ